MRRSRSLGTRGSNPLNELTVILLPPDLDLIRGRADSLDPGAPAGWVYLGNDALFSHALDRELSRLPRIRTGTRLQELARAHRQEYIDFIGDLSARYQGVPWWITSISEKNPFYTDLFLNICRVALCRELARERKGTLLVICGSRGLRETLGKALSGLDGLQVEVHDHPSRIGERAWSMATAVLQVSWFVARYLSRVLLARIFFHPAWGGKGGLPEGKLVLIHSWADGRSFARNGIYLDTFTGSLGDALERRSARVAYLVSILPTYPYFRGILALRRVRGEVHPAEEFITWFDVIAAPWRVRRHAAKQVQPALLPGLDLSPLIREELARDGLDTRRELSCLMGSAARRMGKALSPGSFIYTFENHTWEKMVCLGLGEASPATTRIGYAHSIVIPMNLSYSRSRTEREIAPIPHFIAVNGPRALKVLTESGFEPELVFISGALRYQGEVLPRPAARTRERETILVALPAGVDESLELAFKTIQAFGECQGVNVILKCHPSVAPSRLEPHLPPLPPTIAFSRDPIDILLGLADLVLYSSSTVAVEAVARGVPVVHVKSDLLIDRNIFDGEPSVPSLSLPDEIRNAVEDLLGMLKLGGKIPPVRVTELFSPVKEEQIDRFLGNRGTKR